MDAWVCYLLGVGVILIVLVTDLFLWRITKRVEGKGLRTIIYLFMAWISFVGLICVFTSFFFESC